MSTSLPPLPALKTTRYESVSAFLMSTLGVLLAVTILLSFAWYSKQAPPPVNAIPVEIVDVAGGGSPEGALDGAAEEEFAELPSDDSTKEVQGDGSGVQDVLDNVVNASDQMTGAAQEQFELNAPVPGKPGNSRGSGRRPLGEGPGTGGGVRRELRWYIRYANEESIEEYARQLDYFGVELGAVLNGELVYLSSLSGPRPTVRRVNSGAQEKRLFFTWQGGTRRTADIQLFQKAGMDASAAVLFHFIPSAREQELAQLEAARAKRDARLIRRTYYSVRRTETGRGYEFHITRQIFFDAR